MGLRGDQVDLASGLSVLGLSSRQEVLKEGQHGLHLGLRVSIREGRAKADLPHDRLLKRWSAKYENGSWAMYDEASALALVRQINQLLKSNLIYYGLCASDEERVVPFVRHYFHKLAWGYLLKGYEGEGRAARRVAIMRNAKLCDNGQRRITRCQELELLIRDLRNRHRFQEPTWKELWVSLTRAAKYYYLEALCYCERTIVSYIYCIINVTST